MHKKNPHASIFAIDTMLTEHKIFHEIKRLIIYIGRSRQKQSGNIVNLYQRYLTNSNSTVRTRYDILFIFYLCK